ncbi:unnamed protein product [Nippostrongylus brasiliensis]|uniref:Phosducin domain-containing protein n=1 Tax=Nippostrongylus brasiliensis TaxID=27835 RepID=A0A0N4Y5E1_NIPBR|nr:unnamed protein product [Nippostrongylus brasiliensis]
MASLESKLLDGKNAGYCSSSDEEEGGWKVARDEDQHQANVMRKMGPSTNTGAKGVLSEYAAYQERASRAREAKDREDQFTKAIDTCEGLLCVLIYEPDDEMCDKMTHVCKVMAADYPRVRFMRARSTLLEMSKAFTQQALPTLQVYLNGNLVGNFIQVPSLLGGEIEVAALRKFLRRQHIDLVYGNYTTDSECSTDEDID